MSTSSTLTMICPLRPVMAHRSNGLFIASRGISGNDQNSVFPITINILCHIVAIIYPATTIKEATFNATVKIAFSAFLHYGEFTEKSSYMAEGS